MSDNLRLTYGERAKMALNPAAKELFTLMEKKKTNLGLADDEVDPKMFLELADKLGPEIAVLKTHIDLVRDFTPDITRKLLELKKKHNFVIFEDRKFADIGNTLTMQYGEGIYKIADWANMVNVHIIPGPGIIEGIGQVIKSKNDGLKRGILILAQMSSAGNLATGDYMRKGVEMADDYEELIAGYIGGGEKVGELAPLTSPKYVIITPGVQIQSKSDNLGQVYVLPEEAIAAGSDCIIVGRGIYKAEDPLAMAKIYRKAGWDAYMKRVKK